MKPNKWHTMFKMFIHPKHFACALILTGAVSAFSQGAQDASQPSQPPSKWEKSAALGFTLTRGNSDTLLGTANILATRKAGQNELNLGADGTYGESGDVKTAESIHGFAQYNRLFSERFFGYGRIEGLRDTVADIKYRFVVSPGAGYYFIKTTNVGLRAEIGPGLIYEKLDHKDPKGHWTLRLAERYDQKVSDRLKVWEFVEVLPQVDKWANYIINGEIGLDTSLTAKLSLRTFLQDTFNSKPAPGRRKNDLKLVTAIAYKF
jgi:putative salt-induced outer membrane protein YdiY